MSDRRLDQQSERLDQIETDWSLVYEPAHVVLRYANPVQSYLQALLNNKDDAEEVAQEFFLWVSEHGLPRASQDRGRFRDYLKKVVRSKALTFLRNKQPCGSDAELPNLPAPPGSESSSEQQWLLHWQRCLLKRAWKRLHEYQKRSPQCRYFTVLHLCASYPQEDSRQLAARASSLAGSPLTAEAFRKQVSRARRVFAELLVREVANTIDPVTPAEVEEELVALGLMTYVRDYLPIRQANSKS
jgi:hypothetical protein